MKFPHYLLVAHEGVKDFHHPCLNNSDNLEAKLCFAAGETPCLPIIDSNTASESSLFSMTALASFGMDPSLEKLICLQIN